MDYYGGPLDDIEDDDGPEHLFVVEEDDDYGGSDLPRRLGLRRALVKLVALVLIFGLVLSFPLSYVIQTRPPDAAFFVFIAIGFAVLWTAIRFSRRF